MLPVGSVDFGPRTPIVAAGGGGNVYRCTLTLSATQQTAMRGTVALKEVHAMRDLLSVRQGGW